MRVGRQIAIGLLAVVAAAFWALSVAKRNARMTDLSNLAQAFTASRLNTLVTNSVTFPDLQNKIVRSGKRLNNPLALDVSLPCYRINEHLTESTEPSPEEWIIEETENVNSPYKFRLFGDGSIRRK